MTAAQSASGFHLQIESGQSDSAQQISRTHALENLTIDEAYQKCLLHVANQFCVKLDLPAKLVDKTKELYTQYLQIQVQQKGFKIPRHGQMRTQVKHRRTYMEVGREDDEHIVEVDSQHLADNDSIHGSLRNSFDNQADVGLSMVLQNNPNEDTQQQREDRAQANQVSATKKVYDKFMKSKRHLKTLSKQEAADVALSVTCNLKPDL